MSITALYARSHMIIDRLRFLSGHTPQQREALLEELQAILWELQLRGTQLSLC